MAAKQYTRQELEKVLEKKYFSKTVTIIYPGYSHIHGIVSRIAFEDGIVHLSINYKLYSISLESIKDCVKIIRS